MTSSKTKTICRVALLCFSLSANQGYSLPKGMQVMAGNATTTSSSSNQQIQVSDKTILNWSDFSINAKEVVQFLQPGSTSVVLNRVTGGVPSEILGSLFANGQVFLINQSGIIFGKNSVIQVGSLIASTLDVLDDAFLQGTDILFSGNATTQVVNLGTIKAPGGDVILIGRFLANEGTIDAKHSYVAAGSEVLLSQSESERIFIRPSGLFSGDVGIDNKGIIKALETKLLADGNAYQYAIRDSGTIDASGVENVEGRILLVANQGRINLSGHYTASNVEITGDKVYLTDQANVSSFSSSGGNILVDAGEFYLAPQASLISTNNEIGGKISLTAGRANVSYGAIKANGKKLGGEISIKSLGVLDSRGEVDASSDKTNGSVFFSGENIVVTSDKTSEILLKDTLEYTSVLGFPSKLSPSFIQKTLQGSNVKFTASNRISVQDDVSWDASSIGKNPTTLTIESPQFLLGAEGIRNVHLISQDLKQKNSAINIYASNIHIGSSDRLKPSSLQAKSGDIVIHTNDLHLQGGKNKANFSFDSTSKIQTASGDISILALEQKDLQIVLQGGSGKLSTAEIVSGKGDIFIQADNEFATALLSLKGGSGDNSNAVITSLENGSISCLFSDSSTIKLQGGSGHRTSFAMMAAAQREGEGSLHLKTGKIALLGGSGQDVGDVRALLKARGEDQKIALEIAKEWTLQGGTAEGDLSDARSIIQTEENASIDAFLAGQEQVDINFLGGEGLLSSVLVEVTEEASITLHSNPSLLNANFTMKGGSGEESSVSILASEKGKIKINLPKDSISQFEGGSSEGDSSVKIFSAEGDLSFKLGSLNLLGGPGSGTNTVEICSEQGDIAVHAEGDIKLQAGDSSLSSSAIYTAEGSVSVQAVGDICLHASQEASSLIVSRGTHLIYSDGNIILQAPGKEKAYILNLSKQEGNGFLSLEARRGVEMHGNSLLQNQTDNLSVVSGENLLLKGSRIESLGKGEITLVADDQYEETGIAKGGLLLYKTSAIEGQGPVRIFTSERAMNVIDDVVNGVFFDPQRKFANNSQEKWGTSYPSNYFGEQGFTIFYRENGTCENGTQSIFYLASVLNDQLFYDLFTSYDERVDLETKFSIRKKKVKSMYSLKRHRWFYWSENLLQRRRVQL